MGKTTRPLIRIGWKQTSWKGEPDRLLRSPQPTLKDAQAVPARKVS